MRTDDLNCVVKFALLVFCVRTHFGVVLETVWMNLHSQRTVCSLRFLQSGTLW